jgi:hypothetical protein
MLLSGHSVMVIFLLGWHYAPKDLAAGGCSPKPPGRRPFFPAGHAKIPAACIFFYAEVTPMKLTCTLSHLANGKWLARHTGPFVNGKGNTMLGIYKLEKGALTICLGEEDVDERPTEFASKEGTKVMLLVLQREKK